MSSRNVFASLLALTLAAPFAAFGGEANRSVTISSIHPVGSVRPSNSTSQNIIRVYFNAGAFGSLNCRTDAVDIAVEDWHLYATIMSGWRDNRTVTLAVDDAAKLVAGDVTCRVVAAWIQ